ncbi:uncharacterized protein [Littorina saxatilis]|uniref:Ig-like domain-containing protein n=1 Tax=Littorina saxatilis TaxID=31220 RepID=A0AAN9G0S8_9CAEN
MATSLVLTTLLLHTAVLTVTQVAGTFDLSVVSMTRTLSEDRTQMTLTAEFTASEQPQVAFRTYYKAFAGSTVEYAEGRGTASLTTPVTEWTVIVMRIGKFDIHYLDVYMYLREEEMDQVSMTQMLNTRPSTLSPRNDIAYSRGESFDVIVGVDWSPAETFFWPSPKDSDSNYINAQLTSTYLDQASGEVVKTKDFPSVGNFLTVNKTYQDGYQHHHATLHMSFLTAEEPVYGFFEIFAFSRFSPYSNDDHFVTDLEEHIIITVHESTTPGPFPAGFNYVKATTIPKTCSADKTKCHVKCVGNSNDLKSLAVYKVEEDGTQTDLSERPIIIGSGKYFADILTRNQNHTDSTTGQFVCKVTSRDGSSATGTVTLFRD